MKELIAYRDAVRVFLARQTKETFANMHEAEGSVLSAIDELEAENKQLGKEALAGQKAVEAIENLPMLRRSWGLSLEVKKIVDGYKKGRKNE